jgi:MoaA/NifB/PqqE/SkfB family radical SAM enzyme
MIDVSNIKTRMSRDGLIAYAPDGPLTVRFDREETDNLLKRQINYEKYDDICEVAHLEISNTCNMDCSYCYVNNKGGGELSNDQWKLIIKRLHDYGIFQVTFGGGEPTLYPHLIELAEYVNSLGMNLGMTTNGSTLTTFDPDMLHKLFKQINVSWHQNYEQVEDALVYMYKNSIRAGINYCFSREMAKDNEDVKYLANIYDAEVLYLAYKPVVGDFDNLVDPKEVYKIAKEAAKEGLKVAVDGPCADICLMKKRFCDINHRGDVFPCSFVRETIGNVLVSDFNTIWENRGPQNECPYIKIGEKEV